MTSVEIAAFILAGGRSSRMGTDKAFLVLDGRTLLERAMILARAVTPMVWLVGERDRLARFGAVVEDVHADRGPLGGIHAALSASPVDFNLILAVDTPFVSEGALRFLLQCAEESGAMVTAPRTRHGWEPLCGVYRRAFGEKAGQALGEDRNRIDSLFSTVPVRAIKEAELRRLALDPTMFQNLNTPADWERAQDRAGRS